MTDPTQRFSDRVADYIKYRPKYPPEIISVLEENIGTTPQSIVADIGAGTGFLTELFLKNENYTYAVEPNEAMRIACGELYGIYPNLKIVNGTAEATTLFNNTIDIIVAGQAFHWFNQEACKEEFNRILKPDGHIVLIWNARKDDNPFSKEYDDILLRNLSEYTTIDHRNVDDTAITAFLQPRQMRKTMLSNSQIFDWEGFKGRVRSSSYVPRSGAIHDKIMKEISQLFDHYQQDGKVSFLYDTLIYWSF